MAPRVNPTSIRWFQRAASKACCQSRRCQFTVIADCSATARYGISPLAGPHLPLPCRLTLESFQGVR